MNNTEYHSHPAVSKSHLDQVARSPLHYWSRYVAEDRVVPDPTPAMMLGTALHARVLEPELFAAEYALAPAVDRRTKAGKDAWAEAEAEGKTLLSAADWAQIDGMAAAIESHRGASKLLAQQGLTEASLFWTDDATGIECKCRPDRTISDEWILDLKTTEDASPAGFAKSAWNFRYHVQASWYLDGVRSYGGQPQGFVFIAVEKKPPYAVAVYLADPEMVAAGGREARRCLNLIAECRATGKWPGYGDTAQVLSLPKWAKDS
jgi:exodeoxyribonuclease VIII